MAGAETRSFYDTAYHFADDASSPDLERLWGALRHLEPLAGQDFLDLGGGVGWSSRLARSRGGVRSAVDVDFSRRALELGKASVDDPEGVGWLQADGTALPLATASIDRALSFGSLEHFPDVPVALRELRRVLRRGGRAVLVVPNFYVRTEQPQERREHYFAWRRLIEGQGFAVERVGADVGPPVLAAASLLRRVKRLAGRIASVVPGLQYQFVFVVRPTH